MDAFACAYADLHCEGGPLPRKRERGREPFLAGRPFAFVRHLPYLPLFLIAICRVAGASYCVFRACRFRLGVDCMPQGNESQRRQRKFACASCLRFLLKG